MSDWVDSGGDAPYSCTDDRENKDLGHSKIWNSEIWKTRILKTKTRIIRTTAARGARKHR